MTGHATNVTIVADIRQQDFSVEGADAVICDVPVAGPLAQVVALRDVPAAKPAACAAYVGPGEITHRALIETIALWGLPLLLDTSGATLKEVSRVVGWHQLAFRAGEVLQQSAALALPGGAQICLLHGWLGDAPPNLRAMSRMQRQALLPVGLVDCSPHGIAEIAVAAGASVIVRRPPGLAGYARAARGALALMGADRKHPDASEFAMLKQLRRKLVASRSMPAGHVIALDDLTLESPGPVEGEFAPYQVSQVVGRATKRAVGKGSGISAADLDGSVPEAPPWFSPRPPQHKPAG